MFEDEDNREYEIPISRFFNIIHRYTERIMIYVVTDLCAIREDKVRGGNFYLTKNAYETDAEAERILKYYGDAPVWNVHTDWVEDYWSGGFRAHKGRSICAAIVGNVYYKDIREGYLREKEDRKKEKQRQYRQGSLRRK